MISRTKSILTATAFLVATMSSITAQAEDGVTGNVSIVSNYIWRGATQTNDQPAIQGGLDNTKGSLSFGAWGSGIDTNGTELDLYGNYSFGKISVGLIYYYFAKSTGSTSTYEINVSGDAGPVSLMASYDTKASTYYAEAAYSLEMSKGLNLDTHVGYEGANPDLSAGLTYTTNALDLNATFATKNSVNAISIGVSKSL